MGFLLDALSWICLAAGSFAVLTTGVAFLRMPTFFSRIHGASISDTLGAGLVLLGLVLQAGWSLVSVKLVLILMFLVLTGPATAHALAKAAVLHSILPRKMDKGEPPSAP